MMCLMACLSINVSAAEIESTGQCGENAYWSFDESTGTLTISGTGKIDDAVFYDEETGEMLIDENTGDPVWNMPWYDFKNQIYTLVIEEGITEIGAFAFYSFYFLTEVDFPLTLEVVGCAAFCDCIRLEELDFPDSVHTLYVSNYNEIAIKKIVLPASLETTPTIPGIDGIFDFNMCAYLESLTIPEEIGTIEVTVDGSNPSIRNIYNYSTEALIKFDERNDMWYGDEATAEYMSVSIGAALASIEYEMTEEELEAFVLEKIIEYYGEDYAEKTPEPVLIDTVPDYIKVYCYENSAQHLYCVENNINFVLIDENTHLDSLDNDGVCDVCGLNNMCGEKVYYEFDDATGTLTIKGEGEMYDFLSEPDDEEEGRIAPWRYHPQAILYVVIDEGVASVGDYAFYEEFTLEEISIASTVRRIGRSAFEHSDVKEVVITNGVERIEDNAFDDGEINSVVIPESVTYMHFSAFGEAMVYVSENNPMYSSDEYGVLFDKEKTVLLNYPNCNTDLAEYDVPDSVEIINTAAFRLSSLKKVTLGSALKEVGDLSFERAKIESIIFPDSVEYIGYEAFYDCDDLTEVKFGSGLKQIGYQAFLSCSWLGEIYIPANVYEIEYRAFAYCRNLQCVMVDENNINYSHVDGVLFNKEQNKLILYPLGKTATTYSIPETVKEIGSCAFEGSGLTSVLIPDGVTDVGKYAFKYCENLLSVVIPKGVLSIGMSAFVSNALQDIYYCGTEEQWNNIEKSVYGIMITDNVVVHYNYDVTSPTVVKSGICGENVTWTFYSDGKLVISGTGAMADNFTKFGKLDVKNVIIESGVTTIGGWAFARCDELVSIEIPDTVTSIGDSTFSGCESLTAATIPVSVTTIGKAAFFNCKNLGSVAIPAGITSIAELSFCGCKNLTSVTITKSITHIDKTAFDGCTSLEDVYYDGTVQDWDKITIKSGNDPLINATKIFGDVCRHTEDGHETVTTEEIIDEPTFFDDGSYVEITKCKNCGAELSREIKTIPDVSLLDTIAEEIEEFFKGPISAIANIFKRILRIFGKR